MQLLMISLGVLLVFVLQSTVIAGTQSTCFVDVSVVQKSCPKQSVFHTVKYTPTKTTSSSSSSVVLYEQMKRPIMDQIATALFQIETSRVNASSVVDEKGRNGEPMEWSERTSYANRLSEIMALNPIGYTFKQFVANIVAGEYDEANIATQIEGYIQQDTVVMFSFTTCPFCRKAKDVLDVHNIAYTAIELDTLDDTADGTNDSSNNNRGNRIRAQLGKMTKRTSMPNIFINGKCIGGCNDGYPGLIPLIESGQLDTLVLLK
jgi:glutaredoxin 3